MKIEIKPVDIVKFTVEGVVGIGTGIIIGAAITTVAPAAIGAGLFVTVATKLGAMAINGVVVEKTTNYADRMITKIHDQFGKSIEAIKNDVKNLRNEDKPTET